METIQALKSIQDIEIIISPKDFDKEQEIINDMWSNIGRTFAEYIFLKDFKLNKKIFNNIEIKGINYLNEIKKK